MIVIATMIRRDENWPAKIGACHFGDKFCKFDSISIDFLHREGWQDCPANIILCQSSQSRDVPGQPGPTQEGLEGPEVSLQSVQERWVYGSLRFSKKLLNRQLHKVRCSEHLHLIHLGHDSQDKNTLVIMIDRTWAIPVHVRGTPSAVITSWQIGCRVW